MSARPPILPVKVNASVPAPPAITVVPRSTIERVQRRWWRSLRLGAVHRSWDSRPGTARSTANVTVAPTLSVKRTVSATRRVQGRLPRSERPVG